MPFYTGFSSLATLESALRAKQIILPMVPTVTMSADIYITNAKKATIKPDEFFAVFRKWGRDATQYNVIGWGGAEGNSVNARAARSRAVDSVVQRLQGEMASVITMIAQKKAEIARQLRMQQQEAAQRRLILEQVKAAAEAQARQAAIAAAVKKAQEQEAAQQAEIALTRAREEARTKEIAAARVREAKTLANIAAARKREAAQAKEIAAARARELAKTKEAAIRAKIIEGRSATLARGATADAKVAIVAARIVEVKAGEAKQEVLLKKAIVARSKAEDAVETADAMIEEMDGIVRDTVEAQIVSKERLLSVIEEISDFDKLAKSEYGKSALEDNRAGWLEMIRVKARALPDAERLEVVRTTKKGGGGLLLMAAAGAAAYYGTK